MKILEQVFEFVNKEFDKNKKLEFFKPLKDATEAFFLGTKERAHITPFIRDHIDLKRYMIFVVFALAPAALAGIYFYGLRVLLVIAVSYIFGGIVEVLFALIRKHEINEGFLVTGLLFPLTLPPNIPLWMVAVGIVFGVAIGKELFGGTGHNIFNPALVARCFLYLSYPAAMTSGWVAPGHNITQLTVDSMTGATPLAVFKQTGEIVDLWSLFWGWVPGSIGETSALLLILGGIFLMVTKVANYRTTVGMVVGAMFISSFLRLLGYKEIAPPVFTVLSGGFLLAAIFMATDPVSSPTFKISKWIYGFFTGVIVVLIRAFSGYPEGAMFAVLVMNMFAPMIDHVVLTLKYRPVRG